MSQTGKKPQGKPDQVLVVDENHQLRDAVCRSLTVLGYEVHQAMDREEALEKAVKFSPQVILADIRWMREDQNQLLQRLGQHELDTVVVAMSSVSDMHLVLEMLRVGAVDYLKKPWTPNELVSTMTRAGDIFRRRRQARQGRATRSSPDGLAGGSLAAEPTEPGGKADQGDPQLEDAFNRVIEQLRQGEILLPAIPSVIAKLRALLQRQDTVVKDVVAWIELDQRLSTQLLRLSNSFYYSPSGRSNLDLKTAVSQIGFRQLRSIVETIFVHDCYPIRDARFKPLLETLWKFSIARAVAMRALAELVQGTGIEVDAEDAYMMGLLSDVGAALLLWAFAERSPGEEPGAFDQLLVQTFIAKHHEELGEVELGRWEIDPMVRKLAGDHHTELLDSAPEPYHAIAVLATEIATGFAKVVDLTSDKPQPESSLARCSAVLQIDAAVMEKVKEKLEREFGQILSSLS